MKEKERKKSEKTNIQQKESIIPKKEKRVKGREKKYLMELKNKWEKRKKERK